jgi:hypothetical protein
VLLLAVHDIEQEQERMKCCFLFRTKQMFNQARVVTVTTIRLLDGTLTFQFSALIHFEIQ